MEEVTWQKNAASQIVLDSIFAALAALWLTIALAERNAELGFAEVACSLLSFFSFAISAEGTTNAYDERDVIKFVYYLVWYNVGVVLIGTAILLLVYHRFKDYLTHFFSRALCIAPHHISIFVSVGFLLAGLFLLLTWLRDVWWLFFRKREEFDKYIKELTDADGDGNARPHRRWLMRMLFRHRF